MSNPGQRLDDLIEASGLSRREVAKRIGAARGTILNSIERGKPPRDREQYRRLVDLLGEDPFAVRVSVNDAPAVPIEELDSEQVIDLIAQLLRDPGFASALADRLSPKHAAAFGILSESRTNLQSADGRDRTDDAPGDHAAQA